jgi:hypothetical protein
MEKNVGNTDKLARILIGAVAGVISLAILGGMIETTMLLSPVLGLVALIMLVTGFTNTCPIYRALGMSTLRSSR